jgi:hypothetical protein
MGCEILMDARAIPAATVHAVTLAELADRFAIIARDARELG